MLAGKGWFGVIPDENYVASTNIRPAEAKECWRFEEKQEVSSHFGNAGTSLLLRSKEAGAAAPVCDPEFVQSYEPDLRL